MQSSFSLRRTLKFLSRPTILLCTLWVFGLVIGVAVAAGPDDTIFLLMRLPNMCGLSIIRQLAVFYLPFLFAAYAVSIDKPALLFIICFAKTVVFAFCGSLLFRNYGTAGWLIRLLFLFSDVFTMPVLFWYCIRHIDGQIFNAKRDLIICIILTTIVVCFDFFVVSPFAAELIDYTMGRYAYSCWI